MSQQLFSNYFIRGSSGLVSGPEVMMHESGTEQPGRSSYDGATAEADGGAGATGDSPEAEAAHMQPQSQVSQQTRSTHSFSVLV